MKTAVAMVTIGPDSWTRRYSVKRARAYAQKHGYDFVQVTENSPANAGRTPHWEKVLTPQAYPDYDRWLILDDDVLVNTRIAPALPEVPPGRLAMVKEPVPTQFAPPMEWLGNTGVLLLDRSAADLLQAAYKVGEYKEIAPNYGDQPAVNLAAWRERRVSRLEWKWNYMPMGDWLLNAHRQEYPWTPNVAIARLGRVTLAGALLLDYLRSRLGRPLRSGPLHRLRESYFIHLIWFRFGSKGVDYFLGT